MADSTGIAWTDATWNPIVGCSLVSPGCTNCYAMHQADRILRMNKGKPSHYDGTIKTVNGNPVWTGKLAKAPDHILLQPLRWQKPRRIFVNSMSDLFHESVPDEWIDQVFVIMALSPQHTFQVLTKRSGRMRNWVSRLYEASWGGIADAAQTLGVMIDWSRHCEEWPLPNVWLGVSTEDQNRADERVPHLLATPAATRFVSAEPLLSAIRFDRISYGKSPGTLAGHPDVHTIEITCNALKGAPVTGIPALDQIIVGGESGAGFRPMRLEWAEDIMRQCKDAGVAFFFKQSSAHKPGQRGRASDALWARKEFPS